MFSRTVAVLSRKAHSAVSQSFREEEVEKKTIFDSAFGADSHTSHRGYELIFRVIRKLPIKEFERKVEIFMIKREREKEEYEKLMKELEKQAAEEKEKEKEEKEKEKEMELKIALFLTNFKKLNGGKGAITRIKKRTAKRTTRKMNKRLKNKK